MRILSLLLIAIAQGAQPPPKQSLAQYLQGHPWDASKSGAMLVVNAEGVTAHGKGSGFAAFDRKEIYCGQLTVIAPTNMVIVDAGLQEQPNLYEGLPVSDKLLYLMKSMTSEQWQIASKGGIGLGDLQGEQKAVFNSIVPKPFIVSHNTVQSGNSWSIGNDKEEIPPEQAAEVRLRLFRSISMAVTLQEGRAYTSFPTWPGKDPAKGDQVLMLEQTDPTESDTIFGVKVRKTLPNAEKPSQLDYQSPRLDTMVQLPPSTKLSELVRAVSRATGLTIAADFRVGNLDVSGYGSQVKARDLLRGLARAVTGTYRKVGGRYLLTSDIAGIGSRRLAIAMWKEQVQEQVNLREATWKAEIGKTKNAAYVTYEPSDALGPNEAMNQWMAAHPEPWSNTYMPAADMPPAWQERLRQSAAQSKPDSAIDPTQAEPMPTLSWTFVLPDGRVVDRSLPGVAVGDLKAVAQVDFKADPGIKPKPIGLAAGSHTSVAIRADTPEIADFAVSTAAQYGFAELWLESLDEQTVQEALTKARDVGLTVRLLERPWETQKSGQSDDPEMNILGAQPLQSQARMATMPSWELLTEYLMNPRDQAPPLMSSLDPAVESRWTQLQKLSGSAGLAGTVVCDTQPAGYEPKRGTNVYGGWDRPISDIGHLGYSVQQRLAFLDKYGVDPIDVADMRLHLTPDLNPPFFSGPRLVDGVAWDQAEPYGGASKLVEMLSNQNKAAIGQLLSTLPQPLLVEARRLLSDIPPSPVEWVEPWSSGQDLPTTSGSDESSPGPSGSVCLVKVGFPMSPRMAAGTWMRISDLLEPGKAPIALDMTSVLTSQIGVVLKAWFVGKA